MLISIIAGVLLTLIIGIGVLMHYMGAILGEFDDHFLHLTIFCLVFMIGAAIFLSYAVPSMASPNPYSKPSANVKVYRDTPTKNIIEQFLEP